MTRSARTTFIHGAESVGAVAGEPVSTGTRRVRRRRVDMSLLAFRSDFSIMDCRLCLRGRRGSRTAEGVRFYGAACILVPDTAGR
jgi:hypothetical protein